jgi:GNAT superfamily N-acetyltransferase
LNALVTQYEKRHLGRTFVAVEAGTSSIKGYYTLSAGAFDVSCLPIQQRKKLPRHPCPTIHLARLAVDQAFCGQGLGEMLLMHALRSALDLSHKLAAR